MQKLIILVLCASGVLTSHAQVKFQLSLLSDNKTYVVSMKPEVTWNYPMNITGTAQITLRYPVGRTLTPLNLKTLVPNVLWSDNSYLETPSSARDYNFISFGLRSQGTTAIKYVTGQEVPLFSFQNPDACIGKVELLNNNAVNLSAAEMRIYNIGNHWTTLGNQVEAYTGNLQATATCSGATGTAEDNADKLFSSITAYPVPASDHLTLKINAKTEEVQKINQIKFLNTLGEVVLTKKVKLQSGEQELRFDLATFSAGVYLFQLEGNGASSRNYKFIVL